MRAILHLLLFLGCIAVCNSQDTRIYKDANHNLVLDAGPQNISLLGSNVLVQGSSIDASLSSMSSSFQQQLRTMQQSIANLSAQLISSSSTTGQLLGQMNDLQESLTWTQQMLCSSPAKALLNITASPPILFQTFRAVKVLHFTMDGTHYIAVANQQNTSTNRVVDSEIFRFDGTSLTSVQRFLTRGNYDMDVVNIDGDYYLGVAEFQDTRTTTGVTPSDVWKWDRASQQFLLYQNITAAFAAEGIAFFYINNTPYLATGGAPIFTMTWNSTTAQFQWFQDLSFIGQYAANATGFVRFVNLRPYRIEYTQIEGRGFLGVATVAGPYASIAEVNFTTGKFQKFQDIPALSIRDVNFARVGNDTYLAIANNQGGVPVFVYKWQNGTFIPFQNISIYNTRDIESFTLYGTTYFAFASETGPGASAIFKFDTSLNQFVLSQTFASWPYYAYSCDYFSIGNKHFLVLGASAGGGSNPYDTQSAIFQWTGCSF